MSTYISQRNTLENNEEENHQISLDTRSTSGCGVIPDITPTHNESALPISRVKAKRKLNFEDETPQKNCSRPAINFDDFESTSFSLSLGLGIMSDQTSSRRSSLDSIPSFFSGIERLPRQNGSNGDSTPGSLNDILSDTSPGRLSSYSSTLDSPENILPTFLFGCKSPTETVSHQSATTPLHKLPIVNAPANVNIFKAPTPKAMAMISLKRHHSTLFGPNASFGRTPKYSSTTNELRTPTKHMAIEELNHRYNREFLQIGKLKTRKSGFIFHCLHRLDGFDYAITKITNHTSKKEDEESILNEIFAHSILGKHPNILRYHAAWTENKLIYIQNEFCVGGSLKDLIIKRKSKEKNFSQEELYAILVHVSKGLRYIHSLNLAHLNLKSATVLIQKEKMFPLLDGSSHGNDYAEKLYTYKIADTGHVTNVENPKLEKGDFRYLPREIQKEDFSQVTKADIFSLALTLYEAATLKPLPENGTVWHSIRDSHLDEIEHCDQHFNDLLKMMVHSDPSKRPSAATILSDQYNFPLAVQSKSWLIAKLQEAQQQKDLLTMRLEENGISLADTGVEKHTPLNE